MSFLKDSIRKYCHFKRTVFSFVVLYDNCNKLDLNQPTITCQND